MKTKCHLNGGWTKVVLGPYGVAFRNALGGVGRFLSFFRYEVRDGIKMRFCHDIWCGDQPLKDFSVVVQYCLQ